jgi:hypothetical protein
VLDEFRCGGCCAVVSGDGIGASVVPERARDRAGSLRRSVHFIFVCFQLRSFQSSRPGACEALSRDIILLHIQPPDTELVHEMELLALLDLPPAGVPTNLNRAQYDILTTPADRVS